MGEWFVLGVLVLVLMNYVHFPGKVFLPPPITTKHTEDKKWCRESGPLLGSSPIRSKLDHHYWW